MSDYELDDDDEARDRTYSAALFFAGYGVMRWRLGYPLGDVTIHADGTGLWDSPMEPALFEYDKPLPAHVHHGAVVHVEEHDTTYLIQVPTPREQVMMRLAGIWAEHWSYLARFLREEPCAWPAPLLEKVWPDLTLEYCLTAFEPPCAPQEALRQCVDEVKQVYFDYEAVVIRLAEVLDEEGALSGTEVAALLVTWTTPDDGHGL
jgi:hypothetical protein